MTGVPSYEDHVGLWENELKLWPDPILEPEAEGRNPGLSRGPNMLRFIVPISILLTVLLAGGCQTPSRNAPSPECLKVSGLFSSHMVLQRDTVLPVWGRARPGEKVTATLAGNTAAAHADAHGRWLVRLPAVAAGGPHELLVAGKQMVRFNVGGWTKGSRLRVGGWTKGSRLRDVMIGDVWICAGQSNMEMNLRPGPDAVYNAEREVGGWTKGSRLRVATADYPRIRLFTVPRRPSFAPLDDVAGEGWSTCGPQSVITFSAVGYFFGRDLHQHLGVPIGLIDCTRGASPAEAWTGAEALRRLPAFAQTMKELPAKIAASRHMAPEYKRRSAEWNRTLEERDAGQSEGKPAWAAEGLDASDWGTMSAAGRKEAASAVLPNHWESAGLPDFDGIVWFRKEVDIPAAWAGRPLQLGLCTVNDMDRAYVNGVEVGRFEQTAGWTAPRVYEVPPSAYHAGRNVVTVRVYDLGNKGGICGAAGDLWIRLTEDPAVRIGLDGPWLFKPALDLRNMPPRPTPPPVPEDSQRVPTVLFNAMVAPLMPFAIRGVIWYQGESNVGRAAEYKALFPAMSAAGRKEAASAIRDWRARWGQGEFPFLFVQLAGVDPVNAEPVEDAVAELREAQCAALDLRGTAMAVTIDIGDAENDHPRNKQDVGRRLAQAAQRVAYRESVAGWGPRYRAHLVEGQGVRVSFDDVGGGLKTSDGGPLQGLAVAGVDRVFVWADARIEGNSVVVSSPRVPAPVSAAGRKEAAPVAVRYAWSSNPKANLFNAEGFPASPFGTDSWSSHRK